MVDHNTRDTIFLFYIYQHFDEPLQAAGPINKVLSHPTLPLTITAHEDRHIRFYDNNTGALVHRYRELNPINKF